MGCTAPEMAYRMIKDKMRHIESSTGEMPEFKTFSFADLNCMDQKIMNSMDKDQKANYMSPDQYELRVHIKFMSPISDCN